MSLFLRSEAREPDKTSPEGLFLDVPLEARVKLKNLKIVISNALKDPATLLRAVHTPVEEYGLGKFESLAPLHENGKISSPFQTIFMRPGKCISPPLKTVNDFLTKRIRNELISLDKQVKYAGSRLQPFADKCEYIGTAYEEALGLTPAEYEVIRKNYLIVHRFSYEWNRILRSYINHLKMVYRKLQESIQSYVGILSNESDDELRAKLNIQGVSKEDFKIARNLFKQFGILEEEEFAMEDMEGEEILRSMPLLKADPTFPYAIIPEQSQAAVLSRLSQMLWMEENETRLAKYMQESMPNNPYTKDLTMKMKMNNEFDYDCDFDYYNEDIYYGDGFDDEIESRDIRGEDEGDYDEEDDDIDIHEADMRHCQSLLSRAVGHRAEGDEPEWIDWEKISDVSDPFVIALREGVSLDGVWRSVWYTALPGRVRDEVNALVCRWAKVRMEVKGIEEGTREGTVAEGLNEGRAILGDLEKVLKKQHLMTAKALRVFGAVMRDRETWIDDPLTLIEGDRLTRAGIDSETIELIRGWYSNRETALIRWPGEKEEKDLPQSIKRWKEEKERNPLFKFQELLLKKIAAENEMYARMAEEEEENEDHIIDVIDDYDEYVAREERLLQEQGLQSDRNLNPQAVIAAQEARVEVEIKEIKEIRVDESVNGDGKEDHEGGNETVGEYSDDEFAALSARESEAACPLLRETDTVQDMNLNFGEDCLMQGRSERSSGAAPERTRVGEEADGKVDTRVEVEVRDTKDGEGDSILANDSSWRAAPSSQSEADELQRFNLHIGEVSFVDEELERSREDSLASAGAGTVARVENRVENKEEEKASEDHDFAMETETVANVDEEAGDEANIETETDTEAETEEVEKDAVYVATKGRVPSASEETERPQDFNLHIGENRRGQEADTFTKATETAAGVRRRSPGTDPMDAACRSDPGRAPFSDSEEDPLSNYNLPLREAQTLGEKPGSPVEALACGPSSVESTPASPMPPPAEAPVRFAPLHAVPPMSAAEGAPGAIAGSGELEEKIAKGNRAERMEEKVPENLSSAVEEETRDPETNRNKKEEKKKRERRRRRGCREKDSCAQDGSERGETEAEAERVTPSREREREEANSKLRESESQTEARRRAQQKNSETIPRTLECPQTHPTARRIGGGPAAEGEENESGFCVALGATEAARDGEADEEFLVTCRKRTRRGKRGGKRAHRGKEKAKPDLAAPAPSNTAPSEESWRPHPARESGNERGPYAKCKVGDNVSGTGNGVQGWEVRSSLARRV